MDRVECTIEPCNKSNAGSLPDRVNKLARLTNRIRDAEWRRYGYLLVAGKALGIVVLFGSMFLISNLIGSAVRA